MQVVIELNEQDLRLIVLDHIRKIAGMHDVPIEARDIKIEVKTKSNYRTAQWEDGAFRARVDKHV